MGREWTHHPAPTAAQWAAPKDPALRGEGSPQGSSAPASENILSPRLGPLVCFGCGLWP